MKRPTARQTKHVSIPPPFPAYASLKKNDDMAELVGRLVGYGRPRPAAERAVVIAYVLRGYRAPGLNQIPELDALARILGRGKR